MNKIIDCSLWPVLAGCHTEALANAMLDHHYLVGVFVSLSGFLISLSVIRYFDGPWFIHRCAWHLGGKTVMVGGSCMPLGRSVSLAIERFPFIRWAVVTTDGICKYCLRTGKAK